MSNWSLVELRTVLKGMVSPIEEDPLKEGQILGKCRILRRLKGGGMGVVYLAEHLTLEKRVAVKTLRPHLLGPEHVERFLKEARVCSRIEHPNVVPIYDVGEQDGLYYIVMQYVAGKNLAELVKEQQGPLPWRSAVRIIELAAMGLDAVHARGLVHRDLKPANIMLSPDRRVILMDFGLAREETDLLLSRPGHIAGTPPYMSPEQCRGLKLDRRSDIFSLGSTLYCLLSGRAPFDPATAVEDIASGRQPPRIDLINPSVPPEVAAVIGKTHGYRPEDRFESAALVARELKRIIRQSLRTESWPWARPQLRPAPGGPPEPGAAALVPLPAGREEIVDLVSDRSVWSGKAPWIAVTLMVLVLGLLLNWIVSPNDGGTIVEHPSKPGMVYIPAGRARLGNDSVKLRKFLTARMTSPQLEQVLDMLLQEGQRRVDVPAFWIDRYEVTNEDYSTFLKETGRTPPKHWEDGQPPSGRSRHPVTNVRYEDAEAYADWAGKSLPTCEQWMRAFRGDNDWLFPWGDLYDPSRMNVRDNPAFPVTSPVEATPRDVSPFGVCNMVGNASEFVRGACISDGREWRIGKGSEYKMFGFTFGVSSSRFLYGPGVVDKGLGFRCVLEEP